MPYPEYSASNREHLIYLKEQTQLRYEPIPRKEVYIQAAVPTTDQPYEFSLLYDLYLNAMAVVEFMADGSEKILGWISKNGFVADRPEPEDYIWPDEKSPWIPLHQILEPGEHFLGIKSIHYNVPFYSFLTLDIADNPEGKEASRLCFMNELEPNREYLRWKVILN